MDFSSNVKKVMVFNKELIDKDYFSVALKNYFNSGMRRGCSYSHASDYNSEFIIGLNGLTEVRRKRKSHFASNISKKCIVNSGDVEKTHYLDHEAPRCSKDNDQENNSVNVAEKDGKTISENVIVNDKAPRCSNDNHSKNNSENIVGNDRKTISENVVSNDKTPKYSDDDHPKNNSVNIVGNDGKTILEIIVSNDKTPRCSDNNHPKNNSENIVGNDRNTILEKVVLIDKVPRCPNDNHPENIVENDRQHILENALSDSPSRCTFELKKDCRYVFESLPNNVTKNNGSLNPVLPNNSDLEAPIDSYHKNYSENIVLNDSDDVKENHESLNDLPDNLDSDAPRCYVGDDPENDSENTASCDSSDVKENHGFLTDRFDSEEPRCYVGRSEEHDYANSTVLSNANLHACQNASNLERPVNSQNEVSQNYVYNVSSSLGCESSISKNQSVVIGQKKLYVLTSALKSLPNSHHDETCDSDGSENAPSTADDSSSDSFCYEFNENSMHEGNEIVNIEENKSLNKNVYFSSKQTLNLEDKQSEDIKEDGVSENECLSVASTLLSFRNAHVLEKTKSALEAKKVGEQKVASNQGVRTEDEDKLFFMSLLPEFKKLPNDQKISIKSQIQNLILSARLTSYSKRTSS